MSQVVQLHSLFVLPIRTEDQGPLPDTWVILPGGWAVFFMTHCLLLYLIYSSDSHYISQPSSVHSHSLMINRAAALALPLTATCKLVTLNDSAMHRFTRRKDGDLERLENGGGGGWGQKTRFCNTRLSSRARWVAERIEVKDKWMRTQIKANYVNHLSISPVSFFVGTREYRVLTKDFKWQLVYEFNLRAAKHISYGVKLSNYLPCWVNDRALERQWVLWIAGSETAVLLEGSGLALAVWQCTGN